MNSLWYIRSVDAADLPYLFTIYRTCQHDTICTHFITFHLSPVTNQDQLTHCRSKCNEHIQSSAMSIVPTSSSGSPSSIESLLQHRPLDEQSASFRRSVVSNTRLMSSKSSAHVRPRRLPMLIKVLTGYDDEPYWKLPRSPDGLGRIHAPVIAYIDKPKFEPLLRRRVRSEESVQVAAAAAAAAVWSQSIWSFGSSRMSRVNSEWDAALRWIAVWDSTALAGDVSINEWANHVDDLATVLEACIEQCHSGDEEFRTAHDANDKDYVGTFDVMGSVATSVRDVLWRTVFSWVVGKSLRLSSFASLDTTMQIAASSVAIYAIHSLLSSGWPLLIELIRTLRYTETETPEWLIQHEKDIELAKKSQARQRQKKGSPSKKPKKRQKQRTPAKSDTPNSVRAKQNSGNEDSARKMTNNMTSTALGDDIVQAPDWEHKRVPDDQAGFAEPDKERTFTISNDSVGSCINDGVPSVISLSSATSVTSSPSIKPISPSPSNIPDNLPFGNNAGFDSPTAFKGVYSQQLPRKNAFAVPTVEQRNECANQLRDFQNAQIRRLVLERQQKLAQDSKVKHLPVDNGLAANIAFGKQKNKVLRPPPGFSDFTPVSEDRYQDNLEEEELLLSKLLDDDEDDEVQDTNDVSLPISTESSLDPSAAPFFVPDGGDGKRHRLEPRSSKASNDQWSGSNKIKGVYGGNVW